jgi:hypothetical protein
MIVSKIIVYVYDPLTTSNAVIIVEALRSYYFGGVNCKFRIEPVVNDECFCRI